MLNKVLLAFFLGLYSLAGLQAQTDESTTKAPKQYVLEKTASVWGAKIGGSFANQNWNGQNTEFLLPWTNSSYYVAMFYESGISSDAAMWLEGAYQRKGAAFIGFNTGPNGNGERTRFGRNFETLSAVLGVKKRHGFSTNGNGINMSGYYGLALRGDLNFDNNVEVVNEQIKSQLNLFTFGLNLAMGMERKLSDKLWFFVEAQVMPDLTYLANLPGGEAYFDGMTIYIQPTKLRNFAMTINIGFRFGSSKAKVVKEEEDEDE